MNSLRLKDCCFCISLRTATLIIGYFHAVFSGIVVFAYLAFTIMLAVTIANPPQEIPGHSRYENYIINDIVDSGFGLLLLAITIIVLLLMTVLFSFSVVLLEGVYKKKTDYIKYWMIYTLVTIALDAILLIGFLFSGNLVGKNLILSISSLAWNIYSWILVRSYYYDLKLELSGHEPAADEAFMDKNRYPRGSYQPKQLQEGVLNKESKNDGKKVDDETRPSTFSEQPSASSPLPAKNVRCKRESALVAKRALNALLNS